jgi:transposase
MQHLAIDLGGRESQVCIRDERGRVLSEHRLETQSLSRWLEKQPHSRVVMETCSESFTVASWARACGHEVKIVPAAAVRALGVGARGLKNDVRDAQVLSEVSAKVDLASVHIPSDLSRERKARCTAREGLVEARTKLVNTVRSFLRQHVLRVRCTPDTMPAKVRACLLHTKEGVPSYIEHLLQAIAGLNEQIEKADEELSELAKRDKTCRLLMTIPGVGAVTSMRFVSAIDDPTRFKDAEHVCSYLGLTPGENTTGFKTRRTGITKAGAPHVRRTLSQAAWSLWRTRPNDPLVQWAERVAERRGKPRANTALARKLAALMFAMWRSGQPYNPKHNERQLPGADTTS